uniref:FKBP-type peptidyl-prolyl cis-trans isomerase N-terminal domain-containing protein n=1 Tax=Alistipes sp. TaxID=1872444 RepID=UPI0040571C72
MMKKLMLMLAGAVLLSSCGGHKTVSRGDSSKLDTLSYAIGSQIGTQFKFQMQTIPLNYAELVKGLEAAALNKYPRFEAEEAGEMLQEYFSTKARERSMAIRQQRQEADSIRLASGDSTRVDYPVADPAMFESEQERNDLSYALGCNIGYGLSEEEEPVQIYWVCQAITDTQNGTPQVEPMACRSFMQKYFMEFVPQRNLEQSTAWLAEIEKKSGVVKTESGLLYMVVDAGDMSQRPDDLRDVVKVHYKGTKRNGRVFDASRFADMPKARQEMLKRHLPEDFDKDEPVEFPLNAVIKGWGEGLQHVGKGGQIILWIPADLAYGQRGSRNAIGPNEALRFDIELIDLTPYVEEIPEAPAEEAQGEEAAAE